MIAVMYAGTHHGPFGLNDLDFCGVPPRTRCLRRSLRPEVRYARADDGVTIAYSVAGDGPVTIVVVSPLISRLDLAVLDACDTGTAVLSGVTSGCPAAVQFAASYPARTQALIMAGRRVPRAAHDSDTTPTPAPAETSTRSRRHPVPDRAARRGTTPDKPEGAPPHTRAPLTGDSGPRFQVRR